MPQVVDARIFAVLGSMTKTETPDTKTASNPQKRFQLGIILQNGFALLVEEVPIGGPHIVDQCPELPNFIAPTYAEQLNTLNMSITEWLTNKSNEMKADDMIILFKVFATDKMKTLIGKTITNESKAVDLLCIGQTEFTLRTWAEVAPLFENLIRAVGPPLTLFPPKYKKKKMSRCRLLLSINTLLKSGFAID